MPASGTVRGCLSGARGPSGLHLVELARRVPTVHLALDALSERREISSVRVNEALAWIGRAIAMLAVEYREDGYMSRRSVSTSLDIIWHLRNVFEGMDNERSSINS